MACVTIILRMACVTIILLMACVIIILLMACVNKKQKRMSADIRFLNHIGSD